MATMQGVYITVLGMAILFAALLILMLAAMGLERLFSSGEIAEETPVELEKDKELVAAIAVALKLQAQSSKLKLQSSKEAPSAWKFWGRYGQLMGSRNVKGHRG
jgi:Na+-transporting methylmalonyl-CoA/oxaloacetate decarboxylase gamma subunit